MTKLLRRWQLKKIKEVLKSRRVVVISGARQIGKTTLAQQVATAKDSFVTLDNSAILASVLDDPLGFVRHAKGTMIIDEIQKAPSLILAIKQVVDANNRAGQFLLTGSADIRTLPAISDSLAGRISHIRLRGLTVGEALEVKPTFLSRSFQKDWPFQITGYDKRAVIKLAFRGGYPEVVNLPNAQHRGWFIDYVKSLLSRDLRDIANIQRHDAMEELLNILGAWSSKFMDAGTICSKLAISRNTFNSYLNALISLCLFEKVPAWLRTDYERVGRKEKIFATDTGLMANLLNWRQEEVLFDADRAGKVVETLVFNELIAQLDLDYGYSLFHYRDREDREIDFIVENDRAELLGIEVKSGSMVSKNDCRHLVWFKKNIVKDRHFVGIVLYSGEITLSLGEDMYAVPIAVLWS
ncbi:MAG: ATP-binding protein [Synergistaceae bacterium]|jgi:predicted AAA+ superfamily ATPase|nr:ATP-binding protein [Synergistaceae bacterium]